MAGERRVCQTYHRMCYITYRNHLFIDDNTTTREEVKFYIPRINDAYPDIIENIFNDEHFAGKDDSNHSKFRQYRILDIKEMDKKIL